MWCLKHHEWKWEEGAKSRSDRVFDVDFYSIDGQGTVTDNGQTDSVGQSGQVSGFPSPQADSVGRWTIMEHPAISPEPSTLQQTLHAPNVQFATPPTEGAVDDEGNALIYRTLQDLKDSTEEVHGFQYSGVCFVGAEEPRSVDESLTEECWRKAMTAEMDYVEVFAPVARIETIRLIIALAAKCGWKVHHMDVKSAFLNVDLEEEVYVQHPPGFVVENGSGKVLKLRKALYGLRQAPRAWNAQLDKELLQLGFVKNPHEHVVYRRSDGSGDFLIVGVYVDDLIIAGPAQESIDAFKRQMIKSFSMSDLGLLT
jgi:hypothetical protein